jgi:hypothetical protein
MQNKELRDFAAEQLDRVLGFFGRVDAKASGLFAFDSALLAILCLNIRVDDIDLWYVFVPAVGAVGLLAASLVFTYRSSFPDLAGGNGSLIYFREIAARTEASFIDELTKATDEQITRDLLGQVWRNSEILRMKFDRVKIGFVLAAFALIPWCWFLVAVAVQHGQAPILN